MNCLTNDNLLKTVDNSVMDSYGKFLGHISKVIRDKDNNYISYLILKSNNILDQQTHFFAVPASSAYVKLSKSGKIILQLTRNALHFAKQTAAQDLPKPDFKNNCTIYELL